MLSIRNKSEKFSSRWRSFFKVMLGDFTQKMSIPPVFLKYFEGGFPQEPVLIGPTGKDRKVSVMKIDDDTYFEGGWRLFVQDNSVEEGDFLTFHYEGNSRFNVVVYGTTGCQKKVPESAGKRKRLKIEVDQDCPVDDKAGILQQARNNTCASNLKGDKIEATEEDDDDVPQRRTSCSGVKKECEEAARRKPACRVRQRSSRLKRAKKDDGETVEAAGRNPGRKTARFTPRTKEEYKSIEATKQFKSKHPFFAMTMTLSYTRAKFMNVPFDFHRSLHEYPEEMTLKVSNRSWRVSYRSNGRGKLERSRFASGWTTFSKENALSEGDICIFELIDETNFVMKVSIFRCRTK